MKLRLEYVILDSALKIPAEMIQGRTPDGSLSSTEGFLIDRYDDAVVITHKNCVKGGVVAHALTVPWSNVLSSAPAKVQPAWSDWGKVQAVIYGEPKAKAIA